MRIPAHIQKDLPNDNSPRPVTFELDRAGALRAERVIRAYLNERDDSSDALFPSQRSDRITGKAVNDVVKRLAGRAEIQPYT